MVYMKIIAPVFVIAIVGVLLAGYGAINPQPIKQIDDKVEITFWDDSEDPDRIALWEELIKRFEVENPTIEVEYIALHKDSAKSKFDSAIASDDTPDVASVYTSWLPEFKDRDALLPLDSYFENWSKKEKINSKAIQFNRKIIKDNLLYGIPYTQNLDILWIRSDWFEEENVKIPETWNEFFQAARNMTDKSKDQFGYSIRGGVGGSFQLQRLMYAYSGIGEYIKDGKSTINNQKHVEFLKDYFALYQEYTPKSDIANDYNALIAGFDAGRVAMIQHNLGSYGDHMKLLKDNQFQVIPVPKSMDGRFVVEGGNTIGLSIFKDTEYPKESWEFVRFINSKSAQSYWNQVVGQIPTNSDVLNDSWVKESLHIKKAIEIYNDPETIIYEPAFYLPEYRSILNLMVDSGIQSVLSGKKTVEDFLDEWAIAIEDAMRRYENKYPVQTKKPD
ncbi:ABC transporter substrate-binding protein [Bacillus sp. FJAT-27986]|uniref:ABC transporter substrate-binding protein n=1 Tax=Bacillus sp. FJAT-27986 TaxID=1743146 RepID=UPI00080AC2EB|nr:sugar ABC transporter substrate-binding protein [Bacillus sp. FJAT-27986]OCA89410.1 ABC transporter substrate-binding protein [Bacillus sp. FJAT-27986]